MKRVTMGLAAFLLLACGEAARPFELTPSAWNTGDWIEAVITGSPLVAPDSISLRGTVGEVIAAGQIAIAADSITFLLDLRHAAPGWYDLRLATRSGDVHTEPHCFEVRPLAPPAAWSAPVRLTDEPGVSERPRVAVDRDDRVHVIWQNERSADSGSFDIQYRAHSGSGWSAVEVLSATGG